MKTRTASQRCGRKSPKKVRKSNNQPLHTKGQWMEVMNVTKGNAQMGIKGMNPLKLTWCLAMDLLFSVGSPWYLDAIMTAARVASTLQKKTKSFKSNNVAFRCQCVGRK